MNALVDAGSAAAVDRASVDGSARVFKVKAAPAADQPPRKTVSAAKDPRVAAAVAQGRIAAEKDSGLLANRSLFIFSEENFIRKYAKIIIEWGYPLIASRRDLQPICTARPKQLVSTVELRRVGRCELSLIL